ncbi:methyltransferase-like protein 25B [Chanos chanos]|uniref:Methyltransferase-like protein 25B n=1 Tax=Chanos chanos TaxID=29144 RepID=A0A6J2W2E5_CHACN|nr:protein RRNAD1 [Chanos chanos]
MFSPTLTEQQQRELAKRLTSFLSAYKHISDSYIIEFFTENLWQTLPVKWQEALGDLSPPQIADLLLDKHFNNRTYPTVWPLSLLAFCATAHTLAFPRIPRGRHAQQSVHGKPDEFHANESQSSLLGHLFRKHVKPKKQHEIRKLGMLVKQLCDFTGCNSVIDVGSGQGHLTRFLSFGLGLDVTGIEAELHLVTMASRFDGQLLRSLAKDRLKKPQLFQSAPGPVPHHVLGWVNPRASWEEFIKQLATKEKESESHCHWLCKRQRVSKTEEDRESTNESTAQSNCPTCSGMKQSLLQERTHNNSTDSINQPDSAVSSPESGVEPSSPSPLACPCKFDNKAGVDESPSSAFSSSCAASTLSTDPAVRLSQRKSTNSDFVLTGLHACGDLSATLLRHFANCPHVQGITSVACCYMKISTEENPNPPGVIHASPSNQTQGSSYPEFGYPMSEWVRGLPGHQLSYKAREGACHAVEDYVERLREGSGLLKSHCYRATLETIIRGLRPDLCRAGIQTIKKAHDLSFSEYAQLGFQRVGLPADLPLDHASVNAMLKQNSKVLVYFSLSLLLAPVVETMVLLDRMLFLQEKGLQSQLVALFDPAFSPRNLVLVAVKPRPDAD